MSNDNPACESSGLETERICDAFEASWIETLKQGEDKHPPPDLDQSLLQVSCERRPVLFAELIRLEFSYRRKRGERLDSQAYVNRFPAHALAVQDALKQFSSDASPSANVPFPFQIGRYRTRELIDCGNFGAVYRAFDETLNRDVAIKVPIRDRLTQPESVRAFMSEARILASLKHPHIVAIYDASSDEQGQHFIVSEFVKGTNLAKWMAEGPIGLPDSAILIAKIADALQYAHSKRLVHRDVKPANILLDEQKEPYLTDFGLALTDGDYGRVGPQGGTVAYMGPEQARGEGHLVDNRSDIFSLGVILYELLTGERPFTGETWQDVLRMIINIDARPLRTRNVDVPKEMERICLKALAKRPNDRYPSAEDMAADLRFSVHSPQTASATTSREPRRVPPRIVPKGLRSFDRHDADFFLELVPGPRDRNGLPDFLRFWKTKIETSEANDTCRVGVVYGPSGCGKSSLINAGLIPRLEPRIIPVVVECTSEDTEPRLLHLLRSIDPDALSNASLVDAMAMLRQGRCTSSNQKVVLILDQFEQWLHANAGRNDANLTRALRQCDGTNVQAIVLVRDDFWLALSRFLDNLDVELLEGHNTIFVDLFDEKHAKKVLTGFGRAYGCLPDEPVGLPTEELRFIDLAIAELMQDGKVICVRLSLFAEMIKGEPWIPETLNNVNAKRSIRIAFLDRLFSQPGSNPRYRRYLRASRAVLQALVPEVGSDIKGSKKSVDELRHVSGYEKEPNRFTELMRILDRETRLVAPTESPHEVDSTAPACQEFYQLTHDYLVNGLQEWLYREQKKTRRGRAELLLAKRTSAWKAQPEHRQLPSRWEYLCIRMLTRKESWSALQAQIMKKAGRVFALQDSILGLLFLAVVAGLIVVGGNLRDRELQASVSRELQALISDVKSANVDEIHRLVDDLGEFGDARHRLTDEFVAVSDDTPKRNICLALLMLAGDDPLAPVDEEARDYVVPRLFSARNHAEFCVIRDALLSQADVLKEKVWGKVNEESSGVHERFQAACAAACFYPSDEENWTTIAEDVVDDLLTFEGSQLLNWCEALKPVRHWLMEPLLETFNDRDGTILRRRNAARTLTLFIDGTLREQAEKYSLNYSDTELLVRLVKDADLDQFHVIFEALSRFTGKSGGRKTDVASRFEALLGTRPAVPRDVGQSRQITNVAVAALRMEDTANHDLVWPLLKDSPDPTLRYSLIVRLGQLGVAPRVIVTRLAHEQDDSVRQALILCLLECDKARIRRTRVNGEQLDVYLLDLYRGEPDAGVRQAAGLVLRRSYEEDSRVHVDKVNDALAGQPIEERRWRITSQGLTLIPFDFPEGGYKLEIGATEVTRRQFENEELFPNFNPDAELDLTAYAPSLDCPALGVNYFEATLYCNWLSKKEGLGTNEWCYIFKTNGGEVSLEELLDRLGNRERIQEFWREYTVHLAEDWRERKGFRLPTPEERYVACQSGAKTARFFGEDREVARYCAHFDVAGENKSSPVESLIPNRSGVHGTLGNAWEWCQPGNMQVVEATMELQIRGAAYSTHYDDVDSDKPNDDPADKHDEKDGFRVVRLYSGE